MPLDEVARFLPAEEIDRIFLVQSVDEGKIVAQHPSRDRFHPESMIKMRKRGGPDALNLRGRVRTGSSMTLPSSIAGWSCDTDPAAREPRTPVERAVTTSSRLSEGLAKVSVAGDAAFLRPPPLPATVRRGGPNPGVTFAITTPPSSRSTQHHRHPQSAAAANSRYGCNVPRRSIAAIVPTGAGSARRKRSAGAGCAPSTRRKPI
jgi:hypothetical protein